MDAGSVLDVAFLYFYDYDSIGSTIEISDVTLDNGDVFCGSEDSDSDSRYLFLKAILLLILADQNSWDISFDEIDLEMQSCVYLLSLVRPYHQNLLVHLVLFLNMISWTLHLVALMEPLMQLTGNLFMELALLGTMNCNAISLTMHPKIQQLVKLLSQLQGEMMTKFILLGLKKVYFYILTLINRFNHEF